MTLSTLSASRVPIDLLPSGAAALAGPGAAPRIRVGDDQLSRQALRWAWACRLLTDDREFEIDMTPTAPPRAGDVVLARVGELGEHERLVTRNNKRLRIYPQDAIVGVFGNRYATDAFEGEVCGTSSLSLLTAGGMVGTVKSRHRRVTQPTTLEFAGYLLDAAGDRLNLKAHAFICRVPTRPVRNLVVIVGTGMNSGKTTSSVKLIKGLSAAQVRVAACKLTGSVSNRDQDEMRAAAACGVIDFSDYGFPSTYLCSKGELLALSDTMLADVERLDPEVVVMELADGLLQRETALLLEEPAFRDRVAGVVLTADNALSALYAVSRVRDLGYRVLAVSGVLTSAPLYVRELQSCCDVPVGSSTGDAADLVDLVRREVTQTARGARA